MKLYKFDYRGTIGNNVITVPTDSQFLIGIGNGDISSTAQLFDGSTEIPAEEDKIGEYTCFRMTTAETASRKTYRAVIEGKDIDLLVICKKMSVAYRDLEGNVPIAFNSPNIVKVTQDETIVVTPENESEVLGNTIYAYHYMYADDTHPTLTIDVSQLNMTNKAHTAYVNLYLDSTDVEEYDPYTPFSAPMVRFKYGNNEYKTIGDVGLAFPDASVGQLIINPAEVSFIDMVNYPALIAVKLYLNAFSRFNVTGNFAGGLII